MPSGSAEVAAVVEVRVTVHETKQSGVSSARYWYSRISLSGGTLLNGSVGHRESSLTGRHDSVPGVVVDGPCPTLPVGWS